MIKKLNYGRVEALREAQIESGKNKAALISPPKAIDIDIDVAIAKILAGGLQDQLQPALSATK